ncbi:MAG TPA: glycerate kinase [Candidatus Limnocylindrales bacterium]|nr:glycerate kinase [Candidatus Limnocylindrales bacterium]
MTAAPRRALTVLIAPDSFKGSLTSLEVARALAAGWARARPHDAVLLAPLADGGEGTLVAIEAAGGWLARETEVHDPIGREIRARWLQSADDSGAIVEMAAASGLSRLTTAERDPLGATTRGTGELLLAAMAAGAHEITLGIGGSATNDGGAGILRALGASISADAVDLAGLDPHLASVDLRIACDVTNPLLGPNGAAATYGPQKGATLADVEELDRRLGRFAGALETATRRSERETPGAGAAGGVGFGLLAIQDRFRSFALRPGVDLVMEATGFEEKLGRADLVLTGEGRIDAQTAFGKTALGVARRAAAAGRPCIAVGGGVEPDGIAALAELGVTVVSVAERPQTVEAAMAAGGAPVERCGERLARLVALGLGLGAESRA